MTWNDGVVFSLKVNPLSFILTHMGMHEGSKSEGSFSFAGLSREDSDNGKAPRHCGKTAPKDFGETVTSNAAALRLVFHSNQDDSCKGFAFQYRVETSKFCFVGAHGNPDFSL